MSGAQQITRDDIVIEGPMPISMIDKLNREPAIYGATSEVIG